MRGRSPVSVPRRQAEPARLARAAAGQTLTVPLVSGPYQNNGATQWYGNLQNGTPGQPLRIAVDTGANFVWTTSSLCAPTSCQHYGGGQFIYQQSSTFEWVDQTQNTVDFGPWGSMVVETGKDDVAIDPGTVLPLTMFLSASYSGSQFEQLDWDGGLGVPSGTDYADPSVSFFVAALMNTGMMDPEMPYISFRTDQQSGVGSVLFGGIDPDAIDFNSAVFLPWTPYTAFPNVKYIWTTPLGQYLVGGKVIAANVQFCLDSGSSQFKGDDNIMNTTLQLVGVMPQPDVTLIVGITPRGSPATIVVPPSIYMVKIEAGPQQGQVLPQFNPLGLTNLVLVGSVLMDQLYSTYCYDVTETESGYHLSPVGIWIFNKKNGPQLIQPTGGGPFQLTRRRPHRSGDKGGLR